MFLILDFTQSFRLALIHNGKLVNKELKIKKNISEILIIEIDNMVHPIRNIKFDKELMLAGDIKINDELENYKKIADIIDISGGLETAGLKDISKIEIFLNKIKKLQNET